MAQFGRKTIIAAVATIEKWGHSRITRFLLEHALEDTEAGAGEGESTLDRANYLIRFLLKHPERETSDGENLTDTVVRDLVRRAVAAAKTAGSWQTELPFEEVFPELARALKRDGFEVVDGELRPGLPDALDLPATDDEVHALLKTFGFEVSVGHLDQAIQNHAKGNWAAANAQFRACMESMLDEMAAKLYPSGTSLPPTGHQRRIFLANLSPPFFLGELNEWDGQGKGFLEGFLRRLHPSGSHPGLSDEKDCTFRLHLLLVVSRLLLRRLRDRLLL